MNAEYLKIDPDLISGISFIGSFNSQVANKFQKEVDVILEKYLLVPGVNIADVTKITAEGDKFEHYYLHYGTNNEKRLCSIQRIPDINYTGEQSVKVTVSCKYY